MNSKKKIIFINQSAGYLIIDVINAFAEDYDCVLYTGKLLPISTPLRPDVAVKNFITYNRDTSVKRIFTWAVFTVQVFFSLLRERRDSELFIVTNPPFTPYLGYLLKKWRGTPYHLLIYDVYPDALTQLGMVKQGGWLHRWWASWNRKLFAFADTTFTLSEGMGKLVQQYFNGSVKIISNWTDAAYIKPVHKNQNPFAQQYAQLDKITVMYSGNMGATHAVEKIGELADALKADNRFHFMGIGEGAKKQVLHAMKAERMLNNLTLLPYQPIDVLPFSLATADLGVVTLSAGAEDLSVPCKTYNLLAAGAALFVIASKHSELANLVRTYDCGVQFEEHELPQMKAWLQNIAADPQRLNFLKENARKASFHFTAANAYQYKEPFKIKSRVPEVVETAV